MDSASLKTVDAKGLPRIGSIVDSDRNCQDLWIGVSRGLLFTF